MMFFEEARKRAEATANPRTRRCIPTERDPERAIEHHGLVSRRSCAPRTATPPDLSPDRPPLT